MSEAPDITRAPARRLPGFRNMLHRQLAQWWRSRRWWLHLVFWTALLNGMLAFMLFVLPPMIVATGEATLDDPIAAGLNLFFGMATTAVAIGAIIITHGRIVDEKRTGTAAWVLSKPVSRSAFVLARITADSFSMLAVMLLVPALAAFALLTAFSPGSVGATPFALAVAVAALHLAFYLGLTLLAGVFAGAAATVLGISLGVLLLGTLLRSVAGPVALVTPWLLGDIAGAIALGGAVPEAFRLPPAATALLTVVMIAAAAAGFERSEL
jgi:ABC-2 type transport system permease protein